MAQKWLEVKQTKVSADHAQKLFRSLALHILPKLGLYPTRAVKAPQVIETLKSLAAKTTQ